MEMNQRLDLQNNITQQLKNVIAENLPGTLVDADIDVSLIYNDLVKSRFISITPPLEKPLTMQFFTMDSLRNYKDGSSIKPGNILLNIGKLIEAIPEIVSVGAGMVCDNFVITICSALSLWIKLRDIATIKISKEQAFVIAALWKNCNSNHKISLDDGFIAANNLLNQYGEPEITSVKYNIIIDSLVKMECIKLTEEIIWLREWINREYIYSI